MDTLESIQPRRNEILVVDDHTGTADTITSIIEEEFPHLAGRTHAATSGQEALEKLDALRERLRFVLTDFRMPIIDGIAVATNARQRGMHVMMMTGSESDIPPALSCAVLRKPLDLNRDLPTIARFLRPIILHVDDEISMLNCTRRATAKYIGQKEYVPVYHEADAHKILDAAHHLVCLAVSDWTIDTQDGGADIVAKAVVNGIPTVAVYASHDPTDIRVKLAAKGVSDTTDVKVLDKPCDIETLQAFFRQATMIQ